MSHVEQPVVEVHFGARPTLSTVPSPLRSAGSCSSRIALGLIGLLPALVEGPGAVGGVTPRANPSCSHSLVTGDPLVGIVQVFHPQPAVNQVPACGSGGQRGRVARDCRAARAGRIGHGVIRVYRRRSAGTTWRQARRSDLVRRARNYRRHWAVGGTTEGAKRGAGRCAGRTEQGTVGIQCLTRRRRPFLGKVGPVRRQRRSFRTI